MLPPKGGGSTAVDSPTGASGNTRNNREAPCQRERTEVLRPSAAPKSPRINSTSRRGFLKFLLRFAYYVSLYITHSVNSMVVMSLSITTDDGVIDDVVLVGAKRAAQILNLSPSHLRNLDHRLRPLVTEEGRRIYVRSIVEDVAAERDDYACGIRSAR